MAAPAEIINISSSPRASQPKLPSTSHRLPTVSASQALQELHTSTPKNIASGLGTLDSYLTGSGINGGFERGKVTEIWGPSGAGKTGLMLQAAANAICGDGSVFWVGEESILTEADGATPLSGRRLKTVVEHHITRTPTTVSDTSMTKTVLNRFHHMTAPTLSHLLAVVLHPPPTFPPDDTNLLVITGLNTLLDMDYPRFPFANSTRTEQQKWQAGRRYAVLGSLVSALNKLAVLNNLAVIVTTGCASRTRSDSGLGSALVPGVGGAEWESAVWSRLVVFRDFNGSFVGLQKCQGRSLISREEIGEVGKLVRFDVGEHGVLLERLPGAGVAVEQKLAKKSPVKPRKRTYDEVADSEDEDVDEYGWAENDDDVLATGVLGDESVPTEANG